jgi:hypothetical protein
LFFAVTVTVVWDATLLGAVYTPAVEMLPTGGLMYQAGVTPEGRFTTENCMVPNGARVAVAGLTLGVGDAFRVRLAVPSTTNE